MVMDAQNAAMVIDAMKIVLLYIREGEKNVHTVKAVDGYLKLMWKSLIAMPHNVPSIDAVADLGLQNFKISTKDD